MNRVIEEAKAQIEKEKFDALVKQEKQRLINHKPWYKKLFELFPYEISIKRRKR